MKKYTEMQKKLYNQLAERWKTHRQDWVVGSIPLQNNWNEYNLLFKNIDTTGMVALDFATGLGRCILLYKDRFERIDGADVSEQNIENAEKFLEENGITDANLYVTNGYDLSEIEDGVYDMVFSTIALQHIASYDVRYSYFSEFFRVLKPGGVLSFQMGYGTPSSAVLNMTGAPYLDENGQLNHRDNPNHKKIDYTVGYYENAENADTSNGLLDVRIDDISQLQGDLEKIGFESLEYDIGQASWNPNGCIHPHWIYVRVRKP